MSKNISIGFTGDLSFSGYFKGCHTDNELFDRDIRGFLDSNDYNVINFESPITPCRMTKKKRLAHRCQPDVLQFVHNNIKGPILSLANNHMMDFDRIGMIDTVESVERENLPFVGAGRNVEEACKYIIVGDEVKVGILALQYKKYKIAGRKYAGPLHESKTEIIREKIAELKQQTDYVVLVYHGGDEFLYAPMPYIRKLLKKYLDWGVDVVVAHHPHVVQGYEFFGKKAIFYSLGNFIFDTDYQRAQEGTDKGLLLKLSFDSQGFTFDSLSTQINREDKKIQASSRDIHFRNLNEFRYSELWCTEAFRKTEIKERARLLKEQEIAEREEQKEKEQVRVEQLMMEARLRAAAAEMKENDEESYLEQVQEDDSQENANQEDMAGDEESAKTKISFRKRLKKIYRKVIVKRQDNYRSAVIKMGQIRAKLFYRNRNLFD